MGAGDFRELLPEPLDDVPASSLRSFFPRPFGFKLMNMRPLFTADRAAAKERTDRLHRRICHDNSHDLLLLFLHGCKGNILRGFSRPHDLAGVLLREESLRHDEVKPDRGDDDGERDDEHERLARRAPISGCAHRIGASLESAFADSMTMPCFRCGSRRFKKRPHNIGVSVNETTPETRIATLNVTANS